ncbi:MAG: cytochrome c, partial [Anaerolineales bacterium]|nr:cytochrome c [Anaerolineales bacterium]
MKKIPFTLFILGALLLTACGGGVEGNTPQEIGTLESVPADYAGRTNPLGADASAEGAEIFKTNCETCHGPKGYGDGPIGEALDPKPKNLAEFAPTVEDDFLYWNIAEGRPGTSMPPWKNILTEE